MAEKREVVQVEQTVTTFVCDFCGKTLPDSMNPTSFSLTLCCLEY